MQNLLALPPGKSQLIPEQHEEWWDGNIEYISNGIQIAGYEKDFLRQLQEVLNIWLAGKDKNHPYANGYYSAYFEVHRKREHIYC